ncbi:MAG: SHOCT domain-containing protein [Micromonosporaceae bacterium]
MPLLNIFWTMLWFFVMVLWFFLLFRVIVDIFRSRDLGGWGKAGWTVFIVLLPFLGVFVYLIARGGKMAERDAGQVQAQEEAFRAYVRQAADGGGGTADQLAKLADLHDHGAITDAEYEKGKEQVLHRPAA